MRWVLALVGLAIATPALARALPTPPAPPVQVPQSTAPVPDSALQAPVAPAQSGPTIGLKFYRAPTFDPALGFAPGSRYETVEERKPIQTPGFSVRVPLK
jgi:hypothetical protein